MTKHYHCGYRYAPWEVRWFAYGDWRCPVPVLVLRMCIAIPKGKVGPLDELTRIFLN